MANINFTISNKKFISVSWIVFSNILLTIWYLQSGGQLSLTMLAVQMPGAVVVSYYQGVLNHADFSTWAPYVLTAIQQVILIVMLVIFMCRDKRKNRRSMQSGYVKIFHFFSITFFFLFALANVELSKIVSMNVKCWTILWLKMKKHRWSITNPTKK